LDFEFDLQASCYENMLGPSHKHYMKQKMDLLLRCIREKGLNTKTILDVGCGTGEIERNLANRLEMIGVDLAVSMLRVAKDRYRDCEFLRASCNKLPFRDGAFTMVLVVNVLHHLKLSNRQAFFSEVSKTLAPGGHVVVFEHNPKNPFTRIVVRGCQIDRDAVLLNPEEVMSLANASKIGKVDIKYLTFFPAVLSFLDSFERRMQRLPLGGEFMFLGRKEL
jgi:ubiquinone/menaquinone biosynthesis C-methylase UbiE